MPDKQSDFDNEHLHLVALSLVQGIGPKKSRDLLETFGSATNVFRASYHNLLRTPGIGAHLAREVCSFERFDEAKTQFQRARELSVSFVHLGSDRYPQALKQIYDPPPFLWMAGGEAIDWSSCVAVVGTRRPSEYGKDATRKIVGNLCDAGCVIVSGLAYGIDAIAHRTAVDSNSATVAVLGSGLDIIYPRMHSRLASEILEHGAIISTFPFGTEPEPANFPQRNRLISGISLATVVVEAFEKGGALLTAANALDQNREVMAVPGSIFSGPSRGPNQLIKNSAAKLVQSADDILVELGIDPARKPKPQPQLRELPQGLSEVERDMAGLLGSNPVHVDEICTKLDLSPARASSLLLGLELKGCIRQLEGYYFVRT